MLVEDVIENWRRRSVFLKSRKGDQEEVLAGRELMKLTYFCRIRVGSNFIIQDAKLKSDENNVLFSSLKSR